MNLFLIGAPYQVLNALEAIHYLRLNDNHLRIIDTGHFTRAQFESVIDSEIWASVRFHNFRYKLTHLDFGRSRPVTLWEQLQEYYLIFHQACLRRRADRIIRGTGPIENLFLGNYQRHYDQHMRHFANGLSYRALYLLDVGTDTLRIGRDRRLDQTSAPAEACPTDLLTRLKYGLRRRLLDWDIRGVPSLTFFTSYDLPLYGGDRSIHNDFGYLKSVVASAAPSDTVLFVGQPLVDQCYITLQAFENCLCQVQEFFSGQRLCYVPHPRESKEQLALVRSLGLEVKRFNTPFEYAVAFSGKRPRCVASFFSSVVENCATIFGSVLTVRVFRLPVALLQKDHDEVAAVYEQLQANCQADIEIVDLDGKGENQ